MSTEYLAKMMHLPLKSTYVIAKIKQRERYYGGEYGIISSCYINIIQIEWEEEV